MAARTEPQGERHFSAGALLKDKRARLGWSLKYAATRLGISEQDLRNHEAGFPIAQSRYRRVLKIYNRCFYLLTQGMARQTKDGGR